MKNQINIKIHATLIILALTIAGCGNPNDDVKKLQGTIIQLDKAGWEAWKNKDGSWFEENTTPDFVSISGDGISNKKDVIEATVSDCDIKSYELGSIKFMMISDKSVLLTYTVLQDGTCNNSKLHSKFQVAANYIFQNNKWLEAFYMESKIE